MAGKKGKRRGQQELSPQAAALEQFFTA
ncbi:MAG: hypothetical protein ACJAZ8_001381, partial [Planctomycetota bacterium]